MIYTNHKRKQNDKLDFVKIKNLFSKSAVKRQKL